MRAAYEARALPVLAVILGGFLVQPAHGQLFNVDQRLGETAVTLDDGDNLARITLYSGKGNAGSGNVAPQLLFAFNGETTTLNYLSTDINGPPRFTVTGVLEEIHFDSGVSEFGLRAVSNGLVLASDKPSQRYLADADDDEVLANHIWYENKVGAPGDPVDFRMMQLTQDSGGTLLVDGPVTQNHSFDIAETFWESEVVEPGELVAIDPARHDAVRRTSGAYQDTLLGVASTRPGFILGGGAFSQAALARTWGAEIAEEYERERPTLELAVYAELPELQAAAERLASQGSFEVFQAHARAEREAAATAAGQRVEVTSSSPSPSRLAAAYARALADHETTMFDLTLRRFFGERFSAVALAGRVPVKVDASFGPIAPGDYLTSSPVPGTAMKATRPGPVIGIALQSLTGGAGVIEVFVHRCWYGGGDTAVGGAALTAREARLEAREREIVDLGIRLARMEKRLEQLVNQLPARGHQSTAP